MFYSLSCASWLYVVRRCSTGQNMMHASIHIVLLGFMSLGVAQVSGFKLKFLKFAALLPNST